MHKKLPKIGLVIEASMRKLFSPPPPPSLSTLIRWNSSTATSWSTLLVTRSFCTSTKAGTNKFYDSQSGQFISLPGTSGIRIHDENDFSILQSSIEVDLSSNDSDQDHNKTIGYIADLADTGASVITIKPTYPNDREDDVVDDNLREFLEQVFNLDVSGEPMKERIAVWGPLGIIKRSLELGCTNVVMSNTDKGVDTSVNKNNVAGCNVTVVSATTVVTGLRGRKMAPPTAEEIRRILTAGGWQEER